MYFKENETIGLRSLKKDDLDKYKSFLDNPKVTEYLEMGDRPTTQKILDDTYFEANNTSENIVFAVEDKKKKIFIGTAGLYLINWVARRAQYRILLGNINDSNKGMGTGATELVIHYGFKRLNLEMIYLGVNEQNIQAIKVYEKSGFIKEGKIRKFVYNNGIFYDSINMSITREDFFKNN